LKKREYAEDSKAALISGSDINRFPIHNNKNVGKKYADPLLHNCSRRRKKKKKISNTTGKAEIQEST
jgi:hypothetical protein